MKNETPNEEKPLKVNCNCNNDGCASFFIFILIVCLLAGVGKLHDVLIEIRDRLPSASPANP